MKEGMNEKIQRKIKIIERQIKEWKKNIWINEWKVKNRNKERMRKEGKGAKNKRKK